MRILDRKMWLLVLPMFALFGGVLLFHCSHYMPFIADDSLISLRYASRLLEGQGLTWTDGQPVEGYSNFLWIILISGLGLLGMDLIDASRFLGFACMAVTILSMLCWYIGQYRFRDIWLGLAVGLFFLCLSGPIAVWTIGGLEPPLYCALIALSIPLVYSILERERRTTRNTLLLSLVLGLLCLTRPDGPLFGVAAAIALVVAGTASELRQTLKTIALVATLPVLFTLAQLTFRLYYYGEWVPNTALVKVAPSLQHFVGGWKYLLSGLVALFPFSALAIGALLLRLIFGFQVARAAYLLAMTVLWGLYLVFIGGDFFPAYRHLTPLIVVFAFALVEGVHVLVTLPATQALAGRRILALTLLGILVLVPYTYSQLANKHNQRAIGERWEYLGRDIGVLLKGVFSPKQPLIAVTAAGCIPYWSELPALDMLGLNDYYLPRHAPDSFGQGSIGHELGDGGYVLRRNPDIIVFDVGARPTYKSGAELASIPEFNRRYLPVKVRVQPSGHKALMYFNLYSPKVGIVQSDSEIRIPGYLFVREKSIAFLNDAERLSVDLSPGAPLQLSIQAESASTNPMNWIAEVITSHPDRVRGDVRAMGKALEITLSSDAPKPVNIEEVILRRRI